MPTIDDYRNKFPSLKALDDSALIDRVAEVQGVSRDDVMAHMGYKPKARGMLSVANDLAIEFGNAVAGGVKSVGDVVVPGNPASAFIDENIIKAGEAKQSDVVKAEKARYRAEMEGAEGIGDEVGATLGYVARNPVQSLAQAAGSFVLPGAAVKGGGMLASMAGAGVKGATRAGLAGGAVAGAALSGGDAAGTAYELVKKAGGTDEQATEAARKASVLPAVIGAAGGVVGAERLLAGAKGFGGNAASRALKTAGVEGAQEAIEEGVTQYEGQAAAVPFDPTIDPTKGVAGAATMGAVLGGATGGAVSLLSGKPSEAPKVDPVVSVLAAPSVDDAINAAKEAVGAKPAQRTQAPAELPQMDPDDRREVLGLLQVVNRPGVSPNVARFAQSRMDALLAPYRTIPAGEATEMLPVPDARELTDEERAEYVNAVPFSYRWAVQRGLPQPEVTELLPTGDATEVEPIPAADAFEELPAPEAYEVAPVGEASELLPTPDVAEYDQVPAGEASELDAETIQMDDLLARDGEPFTSKTGAQAKAYASGGGKVVAIPDHFGSGVPGYVVRPLVQARPNNTRGTNAGDVARTAGQRADERGRGDGAAGVPDQRPSDVLASPAGAAGQGLDGAGAAGGGTAAPDALSNGFIPGPNGYKVRVTRHQRGSNVLDPGADVGAFVYEVRNGDGDRDPLTMVVNKDGKLVVARTVLTNNQSNGTAWVPKSQAAADAVQALLEQRAGTEVGSAARKAIDAKIAEAVASDQAGPTGGAAGPTLTEGQRVTLNGTPYTVTAANNTAVKLQGADGGIKMVARNSKTFGQIQGANDGNNATVPRVGGAGDQRQGGERGRGEPAVQLNGAGVDAGSAARRNADAALPGTGGVSDAPRREPGSATLKRPDADPAKRKRQQELIDRLNTYERDLVDRVENRGQQQDSAHNSALGMAGLTEDGLLQARGWAGLYPTMKPGVVVAYDGPLQDATGRRVDSKEPNEAARPQPEAQRAEAAAPAAAPTGAPAAPAVVPGAASGAVEADGVKQPDRVKVMTRQGQNVYVERADLEGDKPRMRHFTSTGKSLGIIVRENLDPTGELRRADAKEAAENPLFDAIGTKDGRVFASEAAAARELSQRGLKDTHEVAPEGNGFIVKRRAPERRKDLERRKRVNEMTPDEMRAALLTDDLTGLNNGRWLRENQPSFSHIIAFDADSLKWVNDNMGHEAGDMLLKAWGAALQQATPNSARMGGDEFFALANSEAEAQRIASAVESALAQAVITAYTPDGDVTIRGIGASFGIAQDRKAADEALNQHKRDREAAGTRAGRGEQPPGTTRKPAGGQQDQADRGGRQDDPAGQEVAAPEAAKSIMKPGFDPDAWQKERDDRIKASREAGNTHLDKVDAYVETMRGLEVYGVHDPKVRGRVLTVDNSGNVYVGWLDAYSQEKEMAVPMKYGKKTVMQTSLGPRDLKDYVVGEPPKATPTLTPKAQAVKEALAAKKGVQPAPVATHKDPGEPAEPVTPAVVREAIKTGVQATDRKPSAMKAELLAKIDAAIADAPDEVLPVWKPPTKDQIRTAMVGMKLTNMDRAEQALRTAHDNRVAEASRRIGHVNFSVEGDGQFKVLNSKPYLEEFRRKVAASPGFKAQRPGPLEGPRDGGENGSGGKVAAFDNMVNEGDLEAASDYADAVGLELDPKKIANATKVLKWRETRPAPAPEAAAQPEAEAPAPAVEPDPLPNPWEISQDEFVRRATFAKEGSTAFPWVAKWGDRILEAENEVFDHPDLGKTVVQRGRFSKTKREAESVARGAHKRAVRRGVLNGNTATPEALAAYPDLQPAKAAEPAPAPAEQAAAILNAAAEPPKGKERLDVLKDVKAGAITPEEVAAAYPPAGEVAAVEPVAEKPAKQPTAKIDDFGQKLEGARKDYAATLKDAEDVDISAEPLSKSWPEPDYQKLLDGGADSFVVAFIHAARDEVPTKPQKSWKLKGWVDAVQTLRGAARGLLDGSISREQLESRLTLRAFDNVRRNVGSRAELYQLVGHDKSLKGITFAEHQYSIYKGQNNVRKWVVEQKAKATLFSNWPRELAVADTKEEMLEQFRARFAEPDATSKDAPAKGKFSLYTKRKQDGVFIGKKIGREYIDLKKLPDIPAARKFLDENTAELETLLEKYKETPFERNPENQPRVGDDHRNGAPVTPKIFEDTFGFRGVQFGNYVEQARRQSDLNQGFDSLMDLAAVLGVPPRALSLNGRLGLAFGARGKGGKNAPAAHYESGNVVINLTKNAGPGSLAHEWWHAVDNYFGKNDGGAAYGTGGALTDKTRAAMRLAFNEVKSATQQGTLRRRAMELDKRKSKPYWDTPIELSARSFESYVIAKLKDHGAANDYLANVVSKEFWDAQEAMRAGFLAEGKPAETYPYPTPDEVPAVRQAFDNFFRVVETRTDDTGNVALFSRAPAERVGLEAADAVGREFWRKIDNGESFTDQEVLDALSINRRGSRRLARGMRSVADQAGTGTAAVSWEGDLASFGAYTSRASWDGDNFNVFFIPDSLAGSADLNDDAQARDKALVHVSFKSAPGGSYELSLNDPQPGTAAHSAAEAAGISAQVGTDAKRYTQVALSYGDVTSRMVLQEAARRLALNIGRTPDLMYAGRDTGARTGKNTGPVEYGADTLRDKFSRTPGARTGVPMADAKAVVATIREALPTAPEIVLHDSVRRAPENLRRLIRQAGADNDVEAVYHDGEIHVFPGNISSIERMQFVVANHEVRHHGLRSMLGPQMGPAMLRMYASNPNLKAAADAKMAAGLADTRILAVEEALADMPVEELQALTGWARIVAAARQWLRQAAAKLRRAGLNALADAMEPDGWTDNDIAALVQRAEDVSRGGAAPFRTGGTVFGREDNPDWYSALADQVGKASMNAGPASAWKALMKNWTTTGKVKADELEWSGLNEWLDMPPNKITKAQVADYLRANGVQVTETVLSGSPAFNGTGWDDGRQSWVVYDTRGEIAADNFDTEADAADWMSENGADYVPAKYGNYTLPGATNYREVLLTLPEKAMKVEATKEQRAYFDFIEKLQAEHGNEWRSRAPIDDRLEAARLERAAKDSIPRDAANPNGIATPRQDRANYRSGHWDQPNIVAHIRVNDRVDADGSRVLFVEELQSDYAQDARKKGIQKKPETVESLDDPRVRLERRFEDGKELTDVYLDGENVQTWKGSIPADYILSDLNEVIEKRAKKGVPAAPYIDATDKWVALAMKRVIKMAVDGGYDKVAFVTGEQSAERYDLSKQVDELMIERDGDSFSIAMKPLGQGYSAGSRWSGKAAELPDVVGKELADKVAAQPEGRSYMRGADLRVGGEGMRAFYNKIVPSVAKDVLRKLGGGAMETLQINGAASYDQLVEAGKRTGKTQAELDAMPVAERKALIDSMLPKQPGFSITQAMRDKALGGMPLFSRADQAQTPANQRATNDAVPADTNAPGQSGDAKGADQGKSIPATPYAVEGFTPAPEDRMSVAMIREANRRGMRHAKSGDIESYYTPVLQAAYNLGTNGVDLSQAEVVSGIRYGKAPPSGVSYNSADQRTENGLSLAQVRGGDEIASVIWFRDRAAYEYRGVLVGEGSDGEAIILPLHVENQDGNLPGVDHAAALKKQKAERNELSAPVYGGAVFSRAGTAKTTAQRQVTQAVRNTVADMLGSAGAKVSWWDKTLGTQYAKAQKFPAYRRVFDAVQQYLEDTSAMANEAADQAKGILPKLETWKDLRNFGLKPADAKAIAAPIFTGTLTDQKVYSDDELRARFNLTPEQIGQYRQFRATVDTSLDQAMAAEALRMLGDKNAGLRELALTDREALREGIEQFLTQQAIDAGEDVDAQGVDRGEFTLLRDDIAEKYQRIDDLKAQGYAPLMRFGKYKVNVTGRETGETLFFGLYESKAAANSALRDMQGDPEFQGADFEQGVLSQEQYKLFSAMPLDSLEMFAEAIGADQSEVFQDFIRLAKSNRSAMKRLLKRKGTAGFSEDVPRVLAAFVTSNARMAAGALNMPTAKEAAQNIRDGDVQDEAIKLLDVVQNPTDTAGAVRGLMFVNFIGGSIASAVVNLTQPLTMTLPYLSQFGGGGKAAKRLMSAGKMVASGKVDDFALRVALKRAETDGIVSPQEIHHLQAQAMGTFGTHPLLQRAAFVWGAPFSLAEQFNRRVSFIAAFQTAREQGIEDAFGFAEKAVIETQGLYNKGNAPNLARGTVGAAALTFRQFSIHYLEWMGRMWKSGPQGKKAVGLALALLILAAGTDGLPFADDLDDLVDTLGQALGYDMNVKRARREFVAEQLGLGDAAADVMARGFSAVPGVPLDVSLRMSMGNLLPGTGMFLRSNTDKSRDLLEIAGPAGGLAKQYIEAGTKALRGDIGGAVQSALPVAFQNAFKAADMWATGEARDTLGRKVMDADAVDGLMKFVGFQPQAIARESEKIQMIRSSEQLAKNVEGEIASAWARAIVDKDADGVAEARAKLSRWNEDNPESPIRIRLQQIIPRAKKLREDRASRFITSVSPERRRAVAEALE